MPNRRLFWVLTNRCNLGCKFCYYNIGLEKRKVSKLSITKVAKIVEQLPEFFDDIVLTGGEPLTYPGIMNLIALLKKKKLRVSLLTNGVLLNKKNCKQLISLGVDSISISLDSLSSKINDLSRGKTKMVLKGINNLLLERPKHINITVLQGFSRYNINSIRPMVDYCKKNNLSLWLNPMQLGSDLKRATGVRLENCSKKELDLLKNEMLYWAKNIKKKSYKKYLRAKKYIKYCLLLMEGKKPKKITCPMGSSFFVLDVDGDIHPCFLRKDILLGNIYKKKLSNILSNPEFRVTLLELKIAPCVQLGCVCFAS